MTDSPRTPLDVELYNAGYKSGYAVAEAARLDRDSLCPFCGHSEHLADVCEYDLGESGECRCIDDRYRVMGHVGQVELVDPALYPRTPAEPEWLREAAQAVIDEWTQTISEGGLVTIALADPIDALRAALEEPTPNGLRSSKRRR